MYNQIAHYYDLSHASLTADFDYLLTLAAQTQGELLELGCGTGRLLLPLAQAGYAITGVDSSSAMLAIARQKLAEEATAVQERVTLLESDMGTFGGNGRFSLALIPYNTLMHLTESQITAVLRHLRPRLQGTLFIDVANPFIVAQTPNDRFLTLEQLFTDPATGHTVAQQASNWLDEAEQQLQVTWLYDATPPQGGPIHRTIAQTTYHYYYPHQLEIALQDAGFRLLHLLGDYDQTPFDEDSERLLILAK